MLSREDKEFCRNYIYVTRWQVAKSEKYKDAPHEYTVKAWNPHRELEFEAFVRLIRRYGYSERFWKARYIYLDIDGYKYWSQGAPVWQTIIINRTIA